MCLSAMGLGSGARYILLLQVVVTWSTQGH